MTLLDRLLPESLHENRSDATTRRGHAQLLVAACLLPALCDPVFAALHWMDGYRAAALADLCAAVFLLLPIAVLRASGDVALGAHVLAGIFGLAIVADALTTGGGIHAPAVLWLPMMPLVATLLAGRGVGGIWFAATLGLTAVLWTATPSVPFDGAVSAALSGRMTLVSAFAAAATLYLLACVAVRLRDESFSALTESMRDGERARREAETATEAKSRFLATMSHELRTPLHGILGMAQLLVGTDITPEQRDFVRTIAASGDALLAAIQDILDFAQIEADTVTLQAVPFEPAALVEDTLSIVAESAERRGLVLFADVAADLPAELVGDPQRLQQVLLHLLGNAIKFTERGHVVLGCRPTPGAGDDRVALRFEVRDTGVGVPDEMRPHIFAAFRQGDDSPTRRHGGTGLGLAIAERLVARMAGRIGLESVPQLGSTFWFTAPLRRSAATRVPTEVEAGLASRRVLVVDPHPDRRTAVARMVRSLGPSADEAAADEAIARARAAHEAGTPYDAIVLSTQPDGSDVVTGLAAVRTAAVLAQVPIVHVLPLLASGVAASRGVTLVRAPLRRVALVQALSAACTREAPGTGPAARLDGGRLLLAEDNQLNQRVTRLLLERLGYTVDVADTGREAVEAAVSRRYALILMDCDMPDMDGIEATIAIRRHEADGPRTPILAVTGHVTSHDRARCLAAGMDDFVSKPIPFPELAAAVHRWTSDRPESTSRGSGAGKPPTEPKPAPI